MIDYVDFDDVQTSIRFGLFGPFFALFGPCSQNDKILTFFEVMVILMTCQPANIFGPFWPFFGLFVLIHPNCQNIEILTFLQ